MKIHLRQEKEIMDYENECGHDLMVYERDPDFNLPRYFVYFSRCEVKEGIMLTSKSGNGDTIDTALVDYCKNISGKPVVFNACRENRKELIMPNLKHTIFLGR